MRTNYIRISRHRASFAAATALAQQPARDPAVGASASATVQATVEAVNMQTREVTLRRDDGELVTLVVSEEARNLAQVAKGDIVTASYQVGLVIALGPPGKEPYESTIRRPRARPPVRSPAGRSSRPSPSRQRS